MFAYKGDVLHTPTPDRFEVFEDGYVVVDDEGTVIDVVSSLPKAYADADLTIVDRSGCLIIPGFNDLHVHAPQYPLAGLGFDYELLDWLEKYTFPAESKYADLAMADHWYRRFITAMWSAGTLRFSAFATLHNESTLRLMELCQQSGLKPVVGKVNMDRNAPDYLVESTQASLAGTEELIRKSRETTPDVGFIVTPRFVPSTTEALMEGLGELVERYRLPVQSHLDESRDEIAWVRELHPDVPSYAEVYERYGLMPRNRTIMAHCVWLTDRERDVLREREVWLTHCAQSNLDLSSGIMPVRRNLDAGLKVCVASDVAGSHEPDMNRHIVMSVEASKAKTFEAGCERDRPLRLSEAFHMATKVPGSFFGKVGSFEPGYEFDALVVREDESPLDLSPQERLERFIYTGDDRDIKERYVSGRLIPQPFEDER
ncbi:amidohydrolase family protein [Bifidobacterium eulemuris]|uniref:Amidohydrolase family protein n=1 Tax=Bifidobacterium eulemuris TaxID=1765219 RepID=A0A261G570_9BIFI|nr:amidohydrolase family protein [Bifidobacterium eulemuris]OZG66562.1 guanine deaminase [Bifidobacterium eulemuris]QOL32646.1 amidohydrolase family protein [Bifidobacterium eulemuris]